MATPPLINVSDSGVGDSDDSGIDSTMELVRPGDEKKKRCEAYTVAKSAGGGVVSSSESDEEK